MSNLDEFNAVIKTYVDPAGTGITIWITVRHEPCAGAAQSLVYDASEDPGALTGGVSLGHMVRMAEAHVCPLKRGDGK